MFGTENDAPEIKQEGAQNAAQTSTHPIFDVVQGGNQQNPAQAAATTETAKEQTEEKSTLFSDTLFDDKSQNNLSNDIDQEVLEKLQQAGYELKKKDVVDENVEIQKKLDFIQKNIESAKEFVRLSDEKIVKEKVTNDFVDLYNQTGRGHLINTPEFEIEVEAEIDSKYSNPGVQKIYADNIRQTVQKNVIDRNTEDANNIIKKQEEKVLQQTQETTKKLQSAFDNIHKNGFMNMKFKDEDLVSAYKNIVNGNFTKEIKESPEELAELAMYYYHKKTLKEQVLGPTFGQGVKTATEIFDGKDSGGKGSPMEAAHNRTAQQTTGFDVNKWLSDEVKSEDQKSVIR